MTCQPFDPNGEPCADDYNRIIDQEQYDAEQEALYPSTAPTDDEHHDAIIAGTYDSELGAAAAQLRETLEGGK